MAKKSTVRSLQELCFTHIVMTLEEYTDEELALLPKRFREQLLHSIPVVDVCRLEKTRFTSGIDMNSVWEYFFHLIPRERSWHHSKGALGWRNKFFQSIISTIINNCRPYDCRTSTRSGEEFDQSIKRDFNT